MKLSEKIRSELHSTAFQMTMLIIVAMLCVNIYAIISSKTAQSVILEDNKNNVQNISQLYMNDLDHRMYILNQYLYKTLPKDKYYNQIIENELDDLSWELSWKNLYMSLFDQARTDENADAYAVFHTGRNCGEVTLRTGLFELAGPVRDGIVSYYSDHHEDLDNNWQILDIDGNRWLVRNARDGDLIYSAMINIDRQENSIIESMSYETALVRITGADRADSSRTDKSAADSSTADEQSVRVVCTSELADISMIVDVDKEEIIQNLPLMQRIGTMIASLLLLLIPVTILFVYKMVIKPIRTLDGAMKRVENGDGNYQICETTRGREFRHLFDSFNRMIRTQKELKIEVYEQKISNQKMEIQNMRLQIHPHFLLNCFNLMYSLAASGEIKRIQQMVLYLSDYFRYIFRSGKEKEAFGKEIQLVRRYLEIAAVRYPDAFTASFEIDEECEKLLIPPLLVHNLIENIINHGLVYGKLVKIRVIAYCEDDTAYIIVSDTGKGIPKDKVTHMNEGIFTTEAQVHIGLKNTQQRINSYLKNGTMIIDSVEGEGTTVEIQFHRNDREAV